MGQPPTIHSDQFQDTKASAMGLARGQVTRMIFRQLVVVRYVKAALLAFWLPILCICEGCCVATNLLTGEEAIKSMHLPRYLH
jgi:hypothetical protein